MYRREHYALELMKTGLLFLSSAKLRPNVFRCEDNPFRSLLVYCIKQIKPGLWLPLNRDYNILGLIKGELSDYTSNLYEHMLLKTEDINFDLLWNNDTECEEHNNFFTFSDFTHPRYYDKKTKDSMKMWQRYEIIIKHTFLGIKTSQNFRWAWGYKLEHDIYVESFNKNMERFK